MRVPLSRVAQVLLLPVLVLVAIASLISGPSAAADSAIPAAVPASTALTLTGPDPAAASRTATAGVVEVYTATSARKSKAGTGVVLNRSGLVITNAHVVDGGRRWAVRVPGTGRLIPAQLVGADRARDIALLRVDERLRPARLGDSDSVAIGDTVTSVGNAYGQGRTARGTGEVLDTSARARLTDQAASSTTATSSGRPGTTLAGLIAARTNIRPGQSGGAMVNQYGEVIGINVAYALTSTSSGKPARAAGRVGYAIPINTALAAAEEILANGAVE